MGCKLCRKEIQIPGDLEMIDPTIFDFIKARKLVELLLSEDSLYKNSLSAILTFNEEQLENLFMGNDDYKYYPYDIITDKRQFEKLLFKFEDFNQFLFEWYRDESKYNNLIKLWRSKLCIYKLKDISDYELEEKLKKAGLEDIDEFLVDFRVILNNSIESKASDINNYLKDEFNDFFSIITTSVDYKNDRYLSKSENEGIFTTNFKNIIEKLVKSSFPLVKNYIKDKYPELNVFSRIQLNGEMQSKLKKILVNKVEKENNIFSGEIGFDKLKNIIDLFKNGNAMKKLMEETQLHYNNPNVAIANLAMSFMNLATSVKTYYNNSVQFDDKTKNYEQKINEINKDFEYHKKQIGILDLDNFEECSKNIEIIGKKIHEDKLKVVEFIKNIDKEEENLKKTEKKSGVKKTAACAAAVVGSALGFVATGGMAAVVYGVAAVANGVALGINVANLVKIKKELNKYKDYKEIENAKYEEISNCLEELNSLYKQNEERYIPINLK